MNISSLTLRAIKFGSIIAILLITSACSNPEANIDIIDNLHNKPVFQNNIHQPIPFGHKGYILIPKADYHITARVLATERYYFDPQSDIMPIDVALAWGPLAKDEYIEQMKISQGRRWYYWRTDTLFMPMKEISANSSNHHLIASNDEIASKIASLDANDIVVLKGMLVDVDTPNGGFVKTSLSRKDTGAGACEVLYVNSLEIFSRQ